MDVLVTDKTGTLTEGRISFTRSARPDGDRSATRRCRSGCWPPRPTVRRRRGRRRQPAGRRALGRRRSRGRLAGRLPAARHAAVRPRPPADVGRGRATPDGAGCSSPRALPRPCWPAAPTSAGGAHATLDDAVRRRQPRRRGRQPRRRRPDRTDRRTTSTTWSWPASSSSSTRRRPAPPRSLHRLAALGITVKVATGDNAARRREGVRRARPDVRRHAHRRRDRRPGRRPRWPPRRGDHHLRPRLARAEGPDHPGAAPARARRRLPRRRRQRRAGPARRRRRHLGRHRHRRRQGRRRRRAAGEGPGRPRRRRHEGPADLRQHDQVRADGHVQQLRQHVQRRGGLGGAAASCRCCRARSCSTTCSTTPASWPSRATASTPSSWHARRTGTSAFIRRFMLFFGPISSLFDFLTFALMLGVFHAGAGASSAPAGSSSRWRPRR